MSVAMALAMGSFGLVVSDSRRVECGGRAFSDGVDKTFTLRQPEIIAAYVGLLEFAGLTVAEHVAQVVTCMHGYGELEAECHGIGSRLADRLRSISENEVAFQHRKLEILVVGRHQLTGGSPRIASVELKPNGASRQINLNVRLWAPDDYYVTVGDDEARAHINRAMPPPAQRCLLGDAGSAREYVVGVVTEAIARSGAHPLYPCLRACGGAPHVRGLTVVEP